MVELFFTQSECFFVYFCELILGRGFSPNFSVFLRMLIIIFRTDVAFFSKRCILVSWLG
jgi:hypothetical protein